MDIRTKFEEIPSKCSGDITFTRDGRTTVKHNASGHGNDVPHYVLKVHYTTVTVVTMATASIKHSLSIYLGRNCFNKEVNNF